MIIAFTPRAWRDWQKLPQNTRNRLQEKLNLYAVNPFKYAVKLSDNKIGQNSF